VPEIIPRRVAEARNVNRINELAAVVDVTRRHRCADRLEGRPIEQHGRHQIGNPDVGLAFFLVSPLGVFDRRVRVEESKTEYAVLNERTSVLLLVEDSVEAWRVSAESS
jgi:hypothetical protein